MNDDYVHRDKVAEYAIEQGLIELDDLNLSTKDLLEALLKREGVEEIEGQGPEDSVCLVCVNHRKRTVEGVTFEGPQRIIRVTD